MRRNGESMLAGLPPVGNGEPTIDGKPVSPDHPLYDTLMALQSNAAEELAQRESEHAAGTGAWGTGRMIEVGRAAKGALHRRARRLGATPIMRRASCGPQRRPRARRTRQTHSPPGGGEASEGEPAKRPAAGDDDDLGGAQ